LSRSAHLEFAAQLVAAHPDQPFVVDHVALPDVRGNVLQPWADRLLALASLENVSCKMSGLDLMAAWHAWDPAQFVPFFDVALAFGPDWLMVASSWPVCTVIDERDHLRRRLALSSISRHTCRARRRATSWPRRLWASTPRRCCGNG
jgi:predicted TIM-barrel fold metal-dependent hydrolase